MPHKHSISRRQFLASTATVVGGLTFGRPLLADEDRKKLAADDKKALIAITHDLEMARNFPRWEDTEWDYQKGNLNAPTKKYARELCRRVKARGGVVHCFLVGQVLEQANVEWLKEIVAEGHPLGNHTYDHQKVKGGYQYRFQRAPWLVQGKTNPEVIVENIRLCTLAMKERLGVEPRGFRTPGGYGNGLSDRTDVQEMLRSLGFDWVSSKSPSIPPSEPYQEPSQETYEGIVKSQEESRPFVYPTGLIEVPFSAPSDITAFRYGRWKLPWFVKAISLGVEWAIENSGTFDLLCHPSSMYVMDPEFRTADMICDLVDKAGHRAAIVDLDTIALRAKLRHGV